MEIHKMFDLYQKDELAKTGNNLININRKPIRK
jgi:hypothetical protein